MNHMSIAQRSALTIAILTSFLGTFLISGVNIALPAIEKEFNLDAVALSWIVISYLLASAVFLLPIGKFADILGQKDVFKGGILIFTLSTILCGIASSGPMLIIIRIIQGLGASMTMTTGAPILVSVFPPVERGKVLGINVASVYLGLSTGPFIGGILTQHFGWRSIFYFCVPLAFAALLLVFFKLKTELNARTLAKIDYKGIFYYSTGLFMLTFIGTQTPVFVIVMILIIMGTGFGLFSSPNMNTIMSSVDRRQLGIASGTSSTMRVVGQMMSMMITTLIFSIFFNGTQLKEADNLLFITSIRLTFAISGMICLAGIYFSNNRGYLRQ